MNSRALAELALKRNRAVAEDDNGDEPTWCSGALMWSSADKFGARTAIGAVLFAVVCCGACAARARVNAECEWIAHSHSSLDDDALLAEDLAIRHADAHRGHRSGHYEGLAEYEHAREQCMAALFDAVARSHGVSTDEVRSSLTHRRLAVDAGVIGSFFVFYGIVAAAVAGWMFRSFSLTRMWAAAAAALGASVPVGVAGWVLGGLWSATLEMIRIGNDHVSYRGERAPWARHQIEFLAACVVVFWLAAAVRHRFIRNEESPWTD